jgi:hypothetical protein
MPFTAGCDDEYGSEQERTQKRHEDPREDVGEEIFCELGSNQRIQQETCHHPDV